MPNILNVKVGDSVFVTYCGAPVGVAGKIQPVTVTKIGKIWLMLSNNVKIRLDGTGFFGIVTKI